MARPTSAMCCAIAWAAVNLVKRRWLRRSTTCWRCASAFAACHFLIDWLKTKAPFWKQEDTGAGRRWVAARNDDDDAAARWDSPAEH